MGGPHHQQAQEDACMVPGKWKITSRTFHILFWKRNIVYFNWVSPGPLLDLDFKSIKAHLIRKNEKVQHFSHFSFKMTWEISHMLLFNPRRFIQASIGDSSSAAAAPSSWGKLRLASCKRQMNGQKGREKTWQKLLSCRMFGKYRDDFFYFMKELFIFIYIYIYFCGGYPIPSQHTCWMIHNLDMLSCTGTPLSACLIKVMIQDSSSLGSM